MTELNLDARGWQILRRIGETDIRVFELTLGGEPHHINIFFPFMGETKPTVYINIRGYTLNQWNPHGYQKDKLLREVELRGKELTGKDAQKWITHLRESIESPAPNAHLTELDHPIWKMIEAYMKGSP